MNDNVTESQRDDDGSLLYKSTADLRRYSYDATLKAIGFLSNKTMSETIITTNKKSYTNEAHKKQQQIRQKKKDAELERRQRNRIQQTLTRIGSWSPEKLMETMDQNWLKQIREHPDDSNTLLIGHINMILMNENHKFGKMIPNFINEWKMKHKINNDIDSNGDIGDISEDIKDFIDKMIDRIETYYKLNKLINNYSSTLIRQIIEDNLFDILFIDLFSLFCRKYKEEDDRYSKLMIKYKNIKPSHLGLPKYLWLDDNDNNNNDDDFTNHNNNNSNSNNTTIIDSIHNLSISSSIVKSSSSSGSYDRAITDLQRISTNRCRSPSKKLKCLIEASSSMTHCINDYWKSKSNEISEKFIISADELVPLFVYLLIKSNVPNIYSLSNYMEIFISETESIQESGYLLATLQTSLGVILHLDSNNSSNGDQS